MLFNSYGFIFVFLPIALLVFFRLGRVSHRYAAAWLTAVSLFFYGWWNPAYVGLLVASIVFNYSVGRVLAQESGQRGGRRRKWMLAFGIGANLLLLGYYKYANFFLANLNVALDTGYQLEQIVLPLGISFFTFTQIAFLVDAYCGKAKEYNFIHYSLFVTYFPHLIAGPVLHHKEMMPQFAQSATYRLHYENVAVGLTIFAIGLFKKAVLADGIAPYASPAFDAAAQGEPLAFAQAWGGALAYTLQLYFDFSGYSDMAIGLSRLFGVTLPLNFHSPYKAVNIIEFWRRWHMTLSRFLRDYLYIPLGGNRKGPARRYANLMATMLLGGLWHGAAWNFVVWGGLHGGFLAVNHAWRSLRAALGQDLAQSSAPGRLAAGTLTFLAVVVAWVFFRAADLDAAFSMLRGMAGYNGFSLPAAFSAQLGPLKPVLEQAGIAFTLGGGSQFLQTWLWVATLLALATLAPNTQQIMARYAPALDYAAASAQDAAPSRAWTWRPNWRWALLMTAVATGGVLSLSQVTEFLYFQF